MNLDSMIEWFDQSQEYLKFERIEHPPLPRRDLCAFLKLHELIPGKANILSGASHDVIFLEVSPNELAKVANEDDLAYLHRCGVRYDSQYDCLSMFV